MVPPHSPQFVLTGRKRKCTREGPFLLDRLYTAYYMHTKKNLAETAFDAIVIEPIEPITSAKSVP